MMTSNFATDIHRKFPNAWNIAQKPNPSQMRTGLPRYLELAPKEELLDEYNNGLVTWAEYTERYQQETLDKLKPFKVYSDLGQDAM
jgi:hypothetical protein